MPTITYALRLRCSNCYSDITLSGEHGPNSAKIGWRRDGKMIALLNKAKRWIAKHPRSRYVRYGVSNDPVVPAELEKYITIDYGLEFRPVYHEFHFVDCPACGGRAYLGSAQSPPREFTQ